MYIDVIDIVSMQYTVPFKWNVFNSLLDNSPAVFPWPSVTGYHSMYICKLPTINISLKSYIV